MIYATLLDTEWTPTQQPKASVILDVLFSLQDDAQHVITVVTQADEITFSPDFVKRLKLLWSDAGVQTCYGRAREYQLNDSAAQ